MICPKIHISKTYRNYVSDIKVYVNRGVFGKWFLRKFLDLFHQRRSIIKATILSGKKKSFIFCISDFIQIIIEKKNCIYRIEN